MTLLSDTPRAPMVRGQRLRGARRVARLAGPLAALLLATTSYSAVPLGTAVGVIPAATAQLGGERVTIIQGAELLDGQMIVTDAAGEVQVVFIDDTRMVIGPNSSLVLERYLLRNDGTFANLTLGALSGTFRFISGNSASQAYAINTPAGTIGVRGTALDITVNALTQTANALVLLGKVSMCPTGVARCVTLEDRCSVGTMIAGTLAQVFDDLRTRERFARETFPYALRDGGLLDILRLARADDCTDGREPRGERQADIVPAGPVVGSSGPPIPPPAGTGPNYPQSSSESGCPNTESGCGSDV